MADEHIGARQVRERLRDLTGAILVYALASEIVDDDAMDAGCGREQIVGFEVENQVQAFAATAGRHDEGSRELCK